VYITHIHKHPRREEKGTERIVDVVVVVARGGTMATRGERISRIYTS